MYNIFVLWLGCPKHYTFFKRFLYNNIFNLQPVVTACLQSQSCCTKCAAQTVHTEMIRDTVKNKLQPLSPNTGILQNNISYTQLEAAFSKLFHILLSSLVYVLFRKNSIYPAFILLPHSSSESCVNSV